MVFLVFVIAIQGIADEKGKLDNNNNDDGITVNVPALGVAAFRIPARDEIKEMEVELHRVSEDEPEIRVFKIDDKYIDEVYRFFENARIDRMPLVGFPDTGSVKLRMKTGEVMPIGIHQVIADKPLQFSIMGVRLKQSERSFKARHGCGAFEGYLRKIYFWQTGHITVRVPGDTLHKIGFEE